MEDSKQPVLNRAQWNSPILPLSKTDSDYQDVNIKMTVPWFLVHNALLRI